MSIIKPVKTMPLPADAKIENGTVRWKNRKGKTLTGILTKNGRVRVESPFWQIRWRDENSIEHREASRCKEKSAALAMLALREKEVERIKMGVVSRDEITAVKKRNTAVSEMLLLFSVKQRAAGTSGQHIQETASKLNVLIRDLALQNISDITREGTEKWIADELAAGNRAPRTINSYIIALKSFCNYLVETAHLPKSPLLPLKKLNESVGNRKKRRAFTAEELQKIYEAARQRQNKNTENEKDGDDRELIYRLLAGTGLRSMELGLVVPFQFDFGRNQFTVDASKTKNKRNGILPVRADLMQRLKKYIAERKVRPAERIFHYTVNSLLSGLKQDLAAAGIEQKTADGRSLDVHSFRKTFGTMLARAGVPLTTTQRLMRHSTPELTAKLYIEIDPVDMKNAVEKLLEI